jgi:transcriptional regulator with GAF, ATPase, and Fis domain
VTEVKWKPRLVAVSGPCERRSFALDGDSFSVGRQKDNDLQLAQLEVSRRHCVLRRDDDNAFLVEDLNSAHGTFVNGRPVRRHRLAHSDLLTVGDSALLYLLDHSSTATYEKVTTTSRFAAATTLCKRPEDILFLDSKRMDEALPEPTRIARDLHALLKISTELHAALRKPSPKGLPRQEALAGQLLDSLLQLTAAERGAVLLCESGSDELRPAGLRHGSSDRFAWSHTVTDRVLRERLGLCCVDIGEHPDLRDAESLGSGVRSLLCAPLLGHDTVLGVLYLDALKKRFTERDLEILTAVAGLASLALENASHMLWIQGENRRLCGELPEHEMIGESAAMKRVLELIARLARADSTVLVRGESGTGKELAARAIHRSSARAEGPFVAVNCATLSETLLESDLFGHEKGAFTGAVARKIGKVEAAHRGTLFLDEVGEVPPTLQAKLLRVLQEREIDRVGGTRPIPVDVRVVAATHRDLEAMIQGGAFREDLYYRLKVITCVMPPLRQRRDDIPLLASHFAALHGRTLRRQAIGIAPKARRYLVAYDWPGNVRELANVIERAVVLGGDDVIRSEDLPDEVLESGAEAPGSFVEAISAAKRRLILDAYKKGGGDYGATAEILGVHVNSLHRMIRTLGLKSQLGR